MITSTKNSRIIDVRKLGQRKHRVRQNRFMVEGLQLLGMAVQAMSTPGGRDKIVPHEVFYSETLFTGPTAPRILDQLIEAGAEAIAVDARVLNTISDRDTSQGIVATFALEELELSPSQLQKTMTSTPNFSNSSFPQLILILDKLQDPGNLGTLIRTADSVAVTAVVMLEPSVDPFDPKTVRSTMGSIFTVPFIRTSRIEATLKQLSQAGYRIIGADAGRGMTVWQSGELAGAVGLILGNEARGLSPELHSTIDAYVSLPLFGQAESLNVAVAGGVLMYEWVRLNKQNR
ncbi:MAG: RNA methyltransferase [Anaerolineae bacterium]|nr:RNA methyltransferase [Anaerolineae bacterium]